MSLVVVDVQLLDVDDDGMATPTRAAVKVWISVAASQPHFL